MMRPARSGLLSWAAAAVAFFMTVTAHAAPPEPADYRMSDYQAETPETLNGKPALTVADAKRLWDDPKALFVDVLPHAPRPEGLAPGTIWQEKPHQSIARALWLPEVGRGALAPETEAYFQRSLAEITGGDKSAILVFFCKRACWMSWNAAKRAETMGYQRVFWYSDGVEGWREANLPMEAIAPRP
jgi:PQQ-dependent catabolism-associated CXXCW motif protein